MKFQTYKFITESGYSIDCKLPKGLSDNALEVLASDIAEQYLLNIVRVNYGKYTLFFEV